MKLSRGVLLASVLLCVASCGIASAGAPQALTALLVAVPGFVVAAVIGTFGRGLQGRVV